ncbi:MAG: PTS glucose transporter subunit IIA [Oribacterium sp.]
MNGEGFEPLVKEGDKVRRGEPILRFSREKIKAAGHPDLVVVLLTNSDDYKDFKLLV